MSGRWDESKKEGKPQLKFLLSVRNMAILLGSTLAIGILIGFNLTI